MIAIIPFFVICTICLNRVHLPDARFESFRFGQELLQKLEEV